jgi:hypothetical protein
MKAKLSYTIFKNSVLTAKKSPHFPVTKINRLTLFKEIIAVYCENRTKHRNILCVQSTEFIIITVFEQLAQIFPVEL